MTRRYLLVGIALATLLGAIYWVWSGSGTQPVKETPERIVINEAARTLLYLPLYHAKKQGYFEKEGVDVDIVTGGTATGAVAALIAGDADLAQADPMYAPISQEGGSDIVVVGQIVARVGLWAVERSTAEAAFDATGVRGNAIITHPQPMTAWTYTSILLKDWGLSDKQVRVIQAKPGTELATWRAEKSSAFLVGVEPTISILEGEGARVVYSWPGTLGDRAFSGLMVRRSTLSNRGVPIRAVLRAYQRSLGDIARSDPRVMETARSYFPNIDAAVIRRALARLVREQVFPKSLRISPDSWSSAISARRSVGDIKGRAAFADNVDDAFTAGALQR